MVGVLANWIFFVFIARAIFRANRARTERSDIKSRSQGKQLQAALAVSTLLGLGWVFGFLLLMNSANYSQILAAFRWMFILFNASQVKVINLLLVGVINLLLLGVINLLLIGVITGLLLQLIPVNRSLIVR